MSKKKRVIVTPTQWAMYTVDNDVGDGMLGKNGYGGMPQYMVLESLVGLGKAERVLITGVQKSDPIELPGEDDEEDGFLGGPNAFDD